MESLFNDLATLALHHLIIAAAAVGMMATASFPAYARTQMRAGIMWTLQPLTVRLPWNIGSLPQFTKPEIEPCLRCELTIVDVFLIDEEGKVARYQKTSDYVVTCASVHAYKEGVTAVGSAEGFECSIGLIKQTVKEHGFCISTIDLGNVLPRGARFSSIYAAWLNDSFTARSEHWTQEVATPTDYLILQIHFPAERSPIIVKCKLLDGLIAHQVKTAEIVRRNDAKSVVWKIPKPPYKAVYKIEWVW
jgi:hypothetical protein